MHFLKAISISFRPLLGTSHLMISTTRKMSKKQLVVLGTGWGSYSVLKSINKKLYDVIVVSPRNHFLFTPLLCSTTVGTLEFRSIIEPIRNLNCFKEFHLSRVSEVDLTKKHVICDSVLKPDLQYKINYDILVIGVGAINSTFNVPGVKEHAFFLKEIIHAQAIRDRLLSNFELSIEPTISEEEQNKLLSIVIVGGGPTGVEFGAELYDFVEQDVSRFYKKHENRVKVTLIESNEILSSFDAPLKAYAEKTMKQRHGFNLLKSSVVEVTREGVKTKDGKFIPSSLVVWSAGIESHDFVKKLDIPKTPNGRILTDHSFRIKGDPSNSSYALGDCAEIINFSLPPTAQVAERQGRFLSKEILNKPDEEPKHFKFKSFGMLAYIGGYKALSDLPGFKLQGLGSYFLWRSAYLTRLGSWRLRLQVAIDWSKTLLYGRDISRFKM